MKDSLFFLDLKIVDSNPTLKIRFIGVPIWYLKFEGGVLTFLIN